MYITFNVGPRHALEPVIVRLRRSVYWLFDSVTTPHGRNSHLSGEWHVHNPTHYAGVAPSNPVGGEALQQQEVPWERRLAVAQHWQTAQYEPDSTVPPVRRPPLKEGCVFLGLFHPLCSAALPPLCPPKRRRYWAAYHLILVLANGVSLLLSWLCSTVSFGGSDVSRPSFPVPFPYNSLTQPGCRGFIPTDCQRPVGLPGRQVLAVLPPFIATSRHWQRRSY